MPRWGDILQGGLAVNGVCLWGPLTAQIIIPTITQADKPDIKRRPIRPIPRSISAYDVTPATNTRRKLQIQTLAQDMMFSSIDVNEVAMNARTLFSITFPRQILNAVLDKDTGK